MAKEVFMPKAGMDMQEGTIIRWHAEVGEAVRAGDPLLDIETDKVAMEVEAPADGILLCKYFDEGAVVPVVTIIGYIGKPGEKVPDRPSMAGGSARAGEQEVLRRKENERPGRDYEYLVAVIGAGPAGYTAALRAAKCGRKTVLFERGMIGGTDLNCGSIPMKHYMHTARMIEEMREAENYGVVFDGSHIHADAEGIKRSADRVIEGMRDNLRKRLLENGVELVCEDAEMIGRHHIRAGQKTYRAENTIICSGAKSKGLDVPGSDQDEIVDAGYMFSLREFPKRMVIIGGGVTGCEMAAAFGRFGTDITVIECQDCLVPTFDADISKEIERSFERCGINVITGGTVEQFLREDNHPVVVLHDGTRIPADLVLLTVGRKPDLTCLGELADKLDYERGKIMVDEYCRTNLDNIYACGDITNKSILAHSALKMGDAAASTACGKPRMVKLNRAPLCLYTVPEAASIGLTELQASKRGDIIVGKCPLSRNARAAATGETEGFVKVIADRGYGEILGVHAVGSMATELIVEAKTMMDMEITVYEVADIMHPHPSYSEAFMEACAAAIGESLLT